MIQQVLLKLLKFIIPLLVKLVPYILNSGLAEAEIVPLLMTSLFALTVYPPLRHDNTAPASTVIIPFTVPIKGDPLS